MARSFCIAALVCSFVLAQTLNVAAQSIGLPLISQEQAAQAGLKRSWVTQVPLDRSRSKVTHLRLKAGLLLAVTSEGMLYVMNADSGQVLWSFRIGSRKLGALAASANANYVTVANTGRLYVLDRAAGNVIVDRQVTGTPERGPELTTDEVVLPLVNGGLEMYSLSTLKSAQLPENVYPSYQPSVGTLAGDLYSNDSALAWAGSQNQFYVQLSGARASEFHHYVPEGVSTTPTLFGSQAYVGTETGYLIAYYADVGDENTSTAKSAQPVMYHRLGDQLWKFSTGSPIRQRPIATNTAVYVLPEDGGMFALQPTTGDVLWFAPDPVQFISVSPQRIYTRDQYGRLAVLDAKTGARIATLKLPQSVKALVNDQSDRLVLSTEDGLIQSLHETALEQPYLNMPPKIEAPKKGSAKPADGAVPAAAPADTQPAGG